jgi:hypothetical protein
LRPLIRPIAATFSLCLTCATFSVLLLWMLCGALAFSQGVLTRNLLLKDKKHGIFLVTTWDRRNTRDTKLLGQVKGGGSRSGVGAELGGCRGGAA